MIRILVFLLTAFFSFYVYGYSLQDLLDTLQKKDIDKAYKIVKQLPFEEKINILAILLLESNFKEEAETMLKLKDSKEIPYIRNIIFSKEFSNTIFISKTEKKLYVIKTISNLTIPILKIDILFNKEPPTNFYFPIAYLTKISSIFKSSGLLILNYPNVLDLKRSKNENLRKWNILIFASDRKSKICPEDKTCIFLSNDDFKKLTEFIKIKESPIIVGKNLELTSNIENIRVEQASIINFIYLWKKAWENSSKDVEKYLSFYSDDFTYKKGNISSWKSYKKKIAKSKKWVKIKISDIRVFKINDIYIASFFMKYDSNNHTYIGKKILYLRKEKDNYRIIGEEVL